MPIYLGNQKLTGGGGGTLPTALIVTSSVNKEFNPGIGVSQSITAVVPSGYTFLCWIGTHDRTNYMASFWFNSPTSVTTNVYCSWANNTGKRTFDFYYMCIRSEFA